MNKLLLFLLSAFILSTPVFSQHTENTIKPNLKYGKPSEQELTLSSYAPDTTATAIYLFRQGSTYFTYYNGFKLVTEQWIRIKVLKPQGTSYADVSVPYYAPADKDASRENATDVEGCSYNMENGKCVKTPLDRSLISYERINNWAKMLKFSIPAVKAGTVLEYHYKVTSDYSQQIDSWIMQEEIPVIYNRYQIKIPNVYIYNIELRGKDFITVKEREASMHGTNNKLGGATTGNDFSISSRELTFTAHHLPAIRQDESYCWCPEDHKVQISFDLQGSHFPGEEYKPYSQKWEDIEQRLTKPEYEPFGMLLSYRNPYREDLKAMTEENMSFEKRVNIAFLLLKKKLVWNKQYQLFSSELDKVVKKGNGSNADLNFVFISILKDLGLKAYPAVLRRRSSGMLPFTYPSLQKLNTFIVAIYNADTQKYVFLDASMNVPAINTLPLELTTERVRILSNEEKEENKWVNLIDLASNGVFMKIEATIDGNQVKGHRTIQLQGQQAADYQSKDHKAPSAPPADNKENLIITNLHSTQTTDNFAQIEENADFRMKVAYADRRLYINPMLFPHLHDNPFIQAERVLPVQLPYPYKHNQVCLLTIPEGYAIEELPKSQSIKSEDGSMQCRYVIQQQGNIMILNYVFSLKTPVFPADQYKPLQELWTKAIKKNQELIVLKKL